MPLLIFQPYTGPSNSSTQVVTANGFDPYFDSVVSQLHFEGADGGTSFTDICNNKLTISGATTTTSTAKFGSSSASFSGGYLTMPFGTFQPSASTGFTIEMWVNPSSTSATTKCIGIGAVDPISATGYWSFGLTAANNAAFYFNTGIDNQFTGATVIPQNAWTHVAVTVTSAGVGTIWVNGVSDATFTLTTPSVNTTNICIGQWNNVKFPGFIDELRITRGVARYAVSFTPSAAVFPDYFAYGTYDPYFDYVSALITGDSAASLTDATNKVAWTSNTAPVNSQTKRFGTSSIQFAGSSATQLISSTSNAATTNGNYTVEFWINPISSGFNRAVISAKATSAINAAAMYIYLNSANAVVLQTNIDRLTSPAIPVNAWTHVAISCAASTAAMYINGVLVAGPANFANTFTAVGLAIGSNIDGSVPFEGYIDDVRITKLVSRYQSAFVLPKTSYPTKSTIHVSGNDVFAKYTILQLRMDGSPGSSTFIDDLGRLATKFGTPTLSSSQFKFGSTAAVFNGTTDYLTFPWTTSDIFGTGEFNFEFWVYPTARSANSTMVSFAGATGTTGISAYLNTTGQIVVGNHTAAYFTTTTTVPLNSWTHIAIGRTGTALTCFVNGVSAGSSTNSTNMSDQVCRIGNSTEGSNWFTGYIDNVRVTKGVNRYPSAFTPDAFPFAALVTTAYNAKFNDSLITSAYDAYSANTILYMPMNGVDGAASFIDACGSQITKNGTPTLSSAQVKYGTTSAFFNGSTDYLVAASGNYALGVGDFTVECWCYLIGGLPNTNGKILLDARPSATNGAYWLLGTNNAGKMSFETTTANGSPELIAPSAVPTGQWVHYAVTRASGNLTLWQNGVSVATATGNADNIGAGPLKIGQNTFGPADTYWNGYIDDIRITKGIARYTSAFTPAQCLPLSPVPLQIGFDEMIPVDYTQNNIITNSGVSMSTQTFVDSGSGYFRGTDYLTGSNPATVQFYSGDFTIECWINPTSVVAGNVAAIMASQMASNSNTGFYFAYDTNFALRFGYNATPELTATTPLTIGVWNHAAVVRSGNSLTLWLNGKSVGTATFTRVLSDYNCFIGKNVDTAYGPIGFIDNLRVTKLARYTEEFVPQTGVVANVPIPTDPYWDKVVVLLSGNDLLDAKGHTVINTGGVSVSSTQKKYGSSSIRFDGTAKWLSIQAQADFAYSGDYTVEAWVNLDSVSGNNPIFSYSATTQLLQVQGPTPVYYVNGISSGWSGNAGTMVAGKWHHIAGVKSGNVCTFYLDGVAVGVTSTHAEALGSITEDIQFGRSGGTYMSGYVSDFRITKGVARYTANFIPPTSALPTAPAATDQYFNNVALLMHMDGADTGTAFPDVKGATVTRNGSAITSISRSMFGSALKLNGSTDYLTVAANSNYSFGTGDFTVELWVYTTGAGLPNTYGKSFIDSRPLDTNGSYWQLGIDSNARLSATTMTSGGTTITSASALPFGQWNHIAFTRNSGTIRLWQNGVLMASATSNVDNISSSALLIGANAFKSFATDTYWNGFIDDVRITKGVGRYTAAFTPPSSPFPDA